MEQITGRQLKNKLDENADLFLLDVRENEEHETFNIGGSLIPLGEIISRAEQIPVNKPVVVYCRKGIRSQIAIQRLQDKFGFTNLINLQGGLDKLEL